MQSILFCVLYMQISYYSLFVNALYALFTGGHGACPAAHHAAAGGGGLGYARGLEHRHHGHIAALAVGPVSSPPPCVSLRRAQFAPHFAPRSWRFRQFYLLC